MSARDIAQTVADLRQQIREGRSEGSDTSALQSQLNKHRQTLFSMTASERAEIMDANTPMACLPVRLETALQPTSLRVRVYPDTIHLGESDLRPTTHEHATATRVAEELAIDPTRRDALHTWMDQLLGPARAELARQALDNGIRPRPDDVDTPVLAAALPDQWTLTLQWTGGTLTRSFPQLVADPLVLGPSPLDQQGILDAAALEKLWNGASVTTATGMGWMIDYDAALAAGMACTVDLTTQDTAALAQHLAQGGTIDDISVFGVRWADAATGAAELSHLLQGHARNRNLRVAEQGSATANDGVHRTPGAAPNLGGPNLDRVASALGLTTETLALAGDSDHDEDRLAWAMNAALWPGTAGAWIPNVLGHASDRLGPFRDWTCKTLRARGPIPAIRVQSEPYGILPLTVEGNGPGGTPQAQSDLDDRIAQTLVSLEQLLPGRSLPNRPLGSHDDWLDAIGHAPHPVIIAANMWSMAGSFKNQAADPILDILGLDPDRASASQALLSSDRGAVSPPMALSRGDKRDPQHSSRTEQELLSQNPLTLQTLFDLVPRKRWPVKPYREMPWVRDIFQTSAGLVVDGQEPGDPLLFTLLRHAVFSHLVEIMQTHLRNAGHDLPPLTDRDAPPGALPLVDRFLELTGLPPDKVTIPMSEEMATELQLPQHLIDQDKALDAALDVLSSTNDVSKLEVAMREHLGLISARPDAWYTALDKQHLDRLRKDQPDGVLIAGVGRVFGLRANPNAGAAQEYLAAHNPSQAITGAILRDGYLRRRAASGDAESFALDLSSSRVKAALEVLEAMRAGRGLGEVIGSQLERALRQRQTSPQILNQQLDALRTAAPLREGLATDGSASPSVDVCDGLKLLEMKDAGTLPANLPHDVIADTAKTMDAIADLMLAEGVHALAAATPDRAGAALDALSRGATPPETFSVVETERSGDSLDVKVLLMGAAQSVPTLSNPPTPAQYGGARGVASGPLADILSRLMGPLTHYGCWVDTKDGDVWITLATLNLDPVSLVLSVHDGAHPSHPLVEALLSQQGRPQPNRDGPNDEPCLSATLVFLRHLQSMVVDARAISADDLPIDTTDATAQSDLSARLTHVRTLADHGQQQLQTALADQNPDALRAALTSLALMGRTDAYGAVAASDETLAVLASSVAASLADDLAQLDVETTPVDGLRLLLGPTVPIVPNLSAADQTALEQAVAAGHQRPHEPPALRKWALEAAKTRPRLQGALDALEAGEVLQDETLFAVCPLQQTGDTWAAITTPQAGTTHAAALLGPLPTDKALAGGIVLDDWTEVIPATNVTAAAAVNVPAPTSRALQTILLALPDGPWSETAPLQALDRAFHLARLRALPPAQLGAAFDALPPVLSFMEPSA